ncbi:MAG: Ig-like domain-containing protein [Lachnospiraceae bacterium]|nr:Ig-like domain-containing protein [Lachnospiraceae bacterium]
MNISVKVRRFLSFLLVLLFSISCIGEVGKVSASSTDSANAIDATSIGTADNSETMSDAYMLLAASKSNYSLSKKKVKLLADDKTTVRLNGVKNGDKITVKSSDSNIVTASYKSKTITLKGINSGKAKVNVTITKTYALFIKIKKVLKVKVSVSPEIASIKPLKKNKVLKVGERKKLKYSSKPFTSTEKPEFTIDDSNIATIDSDGYVTGVKVGKTRAYATINSGKRISWKIVVKPKD